MGEFLGNNLHGFTQPYSWGVESTSRNLRVSVCGGVKTCSTPPIKESSVTTQHKCAPSPSPSPSPSPYPYPYPSPDPAPIKVSVTCPL